MARSVPTVDSPAWTGDFGDDSNQMILARAIFGEARGEPRDGKIAVAWVIRNRADNPRWWGRDIHSVILMPQQFACFNQSDQNRPKVENPSITFPAEQSAWQECFEVAGKVLTGAIPDNTSHADSFHSTSINPDWADRSKFTTQIGNHLFYRLELPPLDSNGSNTGTGQTPDTGSETPNSLDAFLTKFKVKDIQITLIPKV